MDINIMVSKAVQVRQGALACFFPKGGDILTGDLAEIDTALGGAVSGLISDDQIKGIRGEITVLNTLGKLPFRYLVVIGTGDAGIAETETWRRGIAECARALRRKNAGTLAVVCPESVNDDQAFQSFGQSIAEGTLLGLYAFLRHQNRKPEYRELTEVTIVARRKRSVAILKAGVEKGKIIGEAVNIARDMVNEPSNYMTPAMMAEKAAMIADADGLKLEVLDEQKMDSLGMGAALGVSRGSANSPRFILLHYFGGNDAGVNLALVGKGITFDTGGISLKNADKMEEMKGDMAGGASVLAAMSAIAQLKPRLNVTAVVAAAENMPDGKAYKPGDVVTAMNGKTIEVISTDAEGRLTLADALSYVAKTLNAEYVVDVATLTGACVIALGHVCSAAYTNQPDFLELLKSAADRAGEKTWQMPMFEEYKEQYKSDIADMKNVGGRPAGSITAALILSEFIGDKPWIHLDIAGVESTDKEEGYLVKGATGIPTRTLINLALSLSKKGST